MSVYIVFLSPYPTPEDESGLNFFLIIYFKLLLVTTRLDMYSNPAQQEQMFSKTIYFKIENFPGEYN